MRQEQLMLKLPMLNGKTSASLRSLKSHVNSGCKALDRAQILVEGNGSGPARIHEIDSHLGSLRKVVIEVSRDFERYKRHNYRHPRPHGAHSVAHFHEQHSLGRRSMPVRFGPLATHSQRQTRGSR
jgi:hypothetical protein